MSGGGAGHRRADSAAPSAGSGPGGSLRLRWLQASHLKVRNQLVGNLCEDRLGQGRPGSLKTSTHTKALLTIPNARLKHAAFLTSLNFLNGTNWTMSLATASPTVDLRTPSSPSRSSMALKSAGPTPTMMMDIGSREARTMASRVWSKSVISPSVRMSRTRYCCRRHAGSSYSACLGTPLWDMSARVLTEAALLWTLLEATEAT